MRFWLDKGIAGFRCDVINVIYKSSLEDGKKKLALTGSEHYISQEGTHEILRELRREVLDGYDCFTVGETVFVTPQTASDLCETSRHELDMVFSFEHMETDQFFVKWFKRKFNVKRFGRVLSKWQTSLEWNANYLENHDQPRSVSRFGNDGKYWSESAKMLCTLLFTLRGTPYIYQGQEIGMTNFDFISMGQIQDVESINVYKLAKRLHFPARMRWRMIKRTSRDNARTPMQWNAKTNAGFTDGKPWLGVNSNYHHINLESQIDDPGSVRNYYKKMICLRSGSEVLKYGNFTAIKISRDLFVYRRELKGDILSVLLNFSKQSKKMPHEGDMILSSYGRDQYDGILQPYEAVILGKKVAR